MSDELELHAESMETVVLAPRARPARPSNKLNDDERRALVDKHEPVARAWAARYARKAKEWRIDRDEIAQEILLGFFDAARHYEPAHASQATFSTYAYGWVRRRMNDFFQKKYREYHGGRPVRERPEITDKSAGTPRSSVPKRHADRIRGLMSTMKTSEGARAAYRAAVQSGRLGEKDLVLIDALRRRRTSAAIALELRCGLTSVNARQRALATKLGEILGSHS